MLLDRFRVQPAETRKFTVDYSERLQNGATVTILDSLDVDTVTAPPFTVVGGFDAEGIKLILFTSGGVSGEEYKLEITVSTSDGQTWQDEIVYTVEEI